MSRDIFPVLAPQLNVNDETITFIRWLADNGSYVKKGDEICEVETTKAVFAMAAEREGVLYHIAAPDTTIKVGERLGLIGKSFDSIKAFLSREKAGKRKTKAATSLNATPKARKLAEKYKVDLKEVAAMGVRGTIKEADVSNYLRRKKRPQPEKQHKLPEGNLPRSLLKYIEEERKFSRYELFISQKLKTSLRNILYATIDARIDLSSVKRFIQKHKDKGMPAPSLLHIILYALGKILPRFSALTKFQFGNRVYRYRSIDVATIAKAFDNLLYPLVIRQLDKLTLEEVVKTCQSLALRASRHELNPRELEGACFTVSYIPNNAVSRFTALQDAFQSAILSIAGEQSMPEALEGKIIRVPATTLTLSYDHTLMDGWYTADFLSALIGEIKQITA